MSFMQEEFKEDQNEANQEYDILEEYNTSIFNKDHQPQNTNKLDKFVTKVPQNNQNEDIKNIQINLSSNQTANNQRSDESNTTSSGIQSQDIHKLHFLQTISALHQIKTGITMPPLSDIMHLMIRLPPPNAPHSKSFFF